MPAQPTVIKLTSADDTYTAAAGDYLINGLGGNDTITTGAGNSTLNLGDGNATITTGAGNSIVHVGNGNSTITTGAGNSLVTVGDGNATITTGAGDSTVTAGKGNNTITTGSGNNTVHTLAGDQTITTGAGNDEIDVGVGSSTVVSAAGSDVLIYHAAGNQHTSSTFDGGTGIDTLRLALTRTEWMSDTVQVDVAKYLAFLSANTGASGEASAAAFKFNTFGLTASGFEKLQVTVDGVLMDPTNHAVTLGNDVISTTENEASIAVDVLGNDSVPDLIKTFTYTNPSHGSLHLDAAYSDTASPAAAQFIYTPTAGFYDHLAVGETASDAFTYTVTDATGDVKTATVNVTITGTNDAPVITSATQTAAVSEGNGQPHSAMSANGTVRYSDVDLTDTHTLSISAAAAHGNASVDALGNWSYTVVDAGAVNALAAGEHLSDSFTVMVDDGHGGQALQSVHIDITGTNDAPVITSAAQAGAVKEDATLIATGTVTSSDVDHGATALYSGNSAGVYGSFAVNAATGVWTYTLNNAAQQNLAQGENHSETFTVTVTDDKGATATQAVVLSITGTNDAPVIGAQDLIGAVTEQVTPAGKLTDSGTISFSDVDLLDTHTVSAAAASSGTLGTLTASITADDSHVTGTGGAITWNYSVDNANVEYLAAGQTKIETFTVTLSDGSGGSVPSTVNVTINGTNDAPTITVPGTDALGAVTEDARTLTLSDTGVIAFNDVDLTDTHTTTVTSLASNTLGGTLLMGAVVENAITAKGTVGWTYNVNNSATQYLAGGETATEKFNVTVSDSHGGTVTQVVAVTVTGTNDAPVISKADLNGVIYPLYNGEKPFFLSDLLGISGTSASAVNSGYDFLFGKKGEHTSYKLDGKSSGVIQFTDADISDVHSVYSKPDVKNFGVLTAYLTQDTTGSGKAGTVEWIYELPNFKALLEVSPTEPKIDSFSVYIDDQHGGSITEHVQVKLIGATLNVNQPGLIENVGNTVLHWLGF